MRIRRSTLTIGILLGASFLVITPVNALAQGRGNPQAGDRANPHSTSARVSITLGKDVELQIRNFYQERNPSGVRALPPGIRKRLARGKPLPPGIAKQVAPAALRSRIRLPDGYRIVEVGTDVLLIEAATAVVRDVLRDVIR